MILLLIVANKTIYTLDIKDSERKTETVHKHIFYNKLIHVYIHIYTHSNIFDVNSPNFLNLNIYLLVLFK